MSSDDTSDEPRDEAGGDHADPDAVKDRLEEEADRAVEQFDEGLVDVLSWVLETETRARIYVSLRQNPHSTSDEIAEGTGLYPSTVREALAELHDEGRVTRTKRESDGAGNNPYEYAAMPPSDLVGSIVEDVQDELNRVFNLDRMLGPDHDGLETGEEPVTITVEDAATDESDEGSGSDGTDGSEAPAGDGDAP
jgi:predicted transcriptional regulator